MATGHHHHLILSNPFQSTPHDSDDSDDSSSNPHTPTANNPSSGLRAQLHYLLPRHAFFHVVIVVNQITNIPLVSGEFALKWKFKNVYHAPGAKSGKGILGLVKARRKAHKSDRDVKGKRKAGDADAYEQGDAVSLGSGEAVSQRSSSMDGPSASLWSGKSSSSSSSSSSNIASTRISAQSNSTSPSLTSTATTSTTTTASSLPSSLFTGPTLAASPPATTPARGQTAFLPLKDHGVTWEHTLSILVRMDVDRDPESMLLACPVKLIIIQRDPSHPELRPTRFGVMNLDLAQYASKGEVSRRYLLRESKTNATLKLTTHLTHLPTTSAPSSSTSSASSTSTTTNTFTAPPLPKGEILSGLSNVLAGSSALGIIGEHDVYRVRPKGLDLYGPYYNQEELEIDLLGGRVSTTPIKGSSKKKGGKHEVIKKEADIEAPAEVKQQKHGRERSATQSFDPSRLPLAYGPKTTETLIEALFNPVPTSHPTKESPFTVYVPPQPRRPLASAVASPPSSSSTPTSFINTSPKPNLTPTVSSPLPISHSPTVASLTSVTSPTTVKGKSKPLPPKKAGSTGIGAGLGIMGLGMGLGVGMGVGVGVSNAHMEPQGDGSGDVATKREVETGGQDTGAGPDVGVKRKDSVKREERRRASEGTEEEGGSKSGGMKAWWRKKTGSSRPGTPVINSMAVAGMVG